MSSKLVPPVIRIERGTFYRKNPQLKRPALLLRKLTWELKSSPNEEEYWAVVGGNGAGKTTLLQILNGQHFCVPERARSYPFLSSTRYEKEMKEMTGKSDSPFRTTQSAIKLVEFNGAQGPGSQALQASYLSARYESRREQTDFSLREHLQGNTRLNELQDTDSTNPQTWERVIRDFRLGDLLHLPVSSLSNGQMRHARIARAILTDPEVLLLDDPFTGLDPVAVESLSRILHRLARANAPRLILALRQQEYIPEWITHFFYVANHCTFSYAGERNQVGWLQGSRDFSQKEKAQPAVGQIARTLTEEGSWLTEIKSDLNDGRPTKSTPPYKESPHLSIRRLVYPPTAMSKHGAKSQMQVRIHGYPIVPETETPVGDVLVEMEGVKVHYENRVVLGNWKQDLHDGSGGSSRSSHEGLWWTVRRGERWGIFGPNGSGKTTLLALICSDHPQAYSLPIRIFGRSRLAEPGKPSMSIFELQSRIGHSSPEVHRQISRSSTLRQVLENAWSDTLRGFPKLDAEAISRINHCLTWFEYDLRPFGRGYKWRADERDKKHRGNLKARKKMKEFVFNFNPEYADRTIFGEMSLSAQKVALFLRAIIKNPDIILLDEAFSGMDDEVRQRCELFLIYGERMRYSYYHLPLKGTSKTWAKRARPRIVRSELERLDKVVMRGLEDRQALLCISHKKEEIPANVKSWIFLPEAHTQAAARFGQISRPVDDELWRDIWGCGLQI